MEVSRKRIRRILACWAVTGLWIGTGWTQAGEGHRFSPEPARTTKSSTGKSPTVPAVRIGSGASYEPEVFQPTVTTAATGAVGNHFQWLSPEDEPELDDQVSFDTYLPIPRSAAPVTTTPSFSLPNAPEPRMATTVPVVASPAIDTPAIDTPLVVPPVVASPVVVSPVVAAPVVAAPARTSSVRFGTVPVAATRPEASVASAPDRRFSEPSKVGGYVGASTNWDRGGRRGGGMAEPEEPRSLSAENHRTALAPPRDQGQEITPLPRAVRYYEFDDASSAETPARPNVVAPPTSALEENLSGLIEPVAPVRESVSGADPAMAEAPLLFPVGAESLADLPEPAADISTAAILPSAIHRAAGSASADDGAGFDLSIPSSPTAEAPALPERIAAESDLETRTVAGDPEPVEEPVAVAGPTAVGLADFAPVATPAPSTPALDTLAAAETARTKALLDDALRQTREVTASLSRIRDLAADTSVDTSTLPGKPEGREGRARESLLTPPDIAEPLLTPPTSKAHILRPPSEPIKVDGRMMASVPSEGATGSGVPALPTALARSSGRGGALPLASAAVIGEKMEAEDAGTAVRPEYRPQIDEDMAALRDELVNQELLRRELERKGLSFGTPELDARMHERLAGWIGDASWPMDTDGLVRRRTGMSEAVYRRRVIWPELALGRLLRSGDGATEAELRAFWEARRARFSEPEAVRFAQIMVSPLALAGERGGATLRTPAAADWNRAERLAGEVHALLRGGAKFGEVARVRSHDARTSARGGELGWAARGDLMRGLETALFALRPGEYSQPVRTPMGYHILFALERREARSPSFEEALPRVRAAWEEHMFLERSARLVERLRAEAVARNDWPRIRLDPDERKASQ